MYVIYYYENNTLRSSFFKSCFLSFCSGFIQCKQHKQFLLFFFFAAGVNLKTLMQAVMFTVTFTNNKGDSNDDNKDGKIAICLIFLQKGWVMPILHRIVMYCPLLLLVWQKKYLNYSAIYIHIHIYKYMYGFVENSLFSL